MSKKFDLGAFKKTITTAEIAYKTPKYVVLDESLQELIKLPGLPLGHITFDYGLSDTGKSTLLLHSAVQCQKQGILPIIILTGPEKKVDWERARKMGLKYTGDLPKDEQNEDEFIIVVEDCEYIEDVFSFINNKIVGQVEQGKLPYDCMVFWDSAGNTLCRDSVTIDKKTGEIQTKDMHMKAAKIMGEQLLVLSDRITNTRKETRPYFVGCYFITSMYQGVPAFPGAPVPWKIKGGNKPKFVSSLMIRHDLGSKLKATKDGQELKFGMVVKLSITKNHINGKEYSGEFVITEDRVLPNEKGAIEDYKKHKSKEWGDFKVTDDSGRMFSGSEARKIVMTAETPELAEIE